MFGLGGLEIDYATRFEPKGSGAPQKLIALHVLRLSDRRSFGGSSGIQDASLLSVAILAQA